MSNRKFITVTILAFKIKTFWSASSKTQQFKEDFKVIKRFTS